MAKPKSVEPAASDRSTHQKSGGLTEGPVGATLIMKALPMVLGIASIILFNVVDTFFVGQLGTESLAAMSFTFPVTFVIFSSTMGLGVGITAVIAWAIGHGDVSRVRRLSTDGLLLALVIVLTLVMLGLWTQEILFKWLGASEAMIPLILDYMTLWWLGVGFLVIPMMGNSAIRATGDTQTPAYIMVVAGVLNIVLDPILIFGWGPIPRLGLVGAALATVISRVLTLVAALWVLIWRENMVSFEWPGSKLWDSWYSIMKVGLPASATNILTPLAAAVLTRLVATQGTTAVAAWGVAQRIEGLGMVWIGALASALTPFVAQNVGAGLCTRLRVAARFSVGVSLVMGISISVLMALLAPCIARVFSDQPQVMNLVTSFLRIVPISYTMLGCAQFASAFFNGSLKPMRAAVLSIFRLFVCVVPLSWLGVQMGGIEGMYLGIALGNGLVGLLAIKMIWSLIQGVEESIETQSLEKLVPVKV